jgi:hypothetical protein
MRKWGPILLVLPALPALALDKSVPETAVTEIDVSKLRPGQFIWIEPDAIKGTHALTLTGFDENGKSKWLYVGMPGNDNEAVNPIDMIATRKVRIPQVFYDDVHAILKPGANMIATEDSMEEGSPGAPVAVLSNS